MRRAFRFAVFALSLFSITTSPQQRPTTGNIEGIVVRADTEQPIANAQIILTQIADGPTPGAVAANGVAGAIAPATTGADGKFAFKDVKPATYRVAATATGFVRQEYGQRTPKGSGRLLFVVAGQAISDANIQLTQTGTIKGRILDERGQPATGAPVQLLRAIYDVQGKRYQPAGSAAVDDQGNYRIFGVPPGRYYLRAGTPPAVLNLLPARVTAPAGSGQRYAIVYYPNVSKEDEAAAIDVRAGNESSVDMRVRRVTQAFHVRGRVINPTNAPIPQNMAMSLAYYTFSSWGGSPRPNSFDAATGVFDVAAVPPGEFSIEIAPTLQPQLGRGAAGILEQQVQRAMALSASVPIHVTDADIEGLVLTLAPGVSAQGKLIVEGQPLSAVPNLDQLRLNVVNVLRPAPFSLTSSVIATDGSFQVTGLREAEYLAQINGNFPGFYVKSLKFGKEDVLGKPFKFGGRDSASFEVVLKAGIQTITGSVTDSQSKPVSGIAVVLIPAQREKVGLIRTTNTDQNGKFTVTNLAPGEYKLFSWEAIDNNAYLDPDFLKEYEQLGKAISVTESSNSSIDVKLILAQ